MALFSLQDTLLCCLDLVQIEIFFFLTFYIFQVNAGLNLLWNQFYVIVSLIFIIDNILDESLLVNFHYLRYWIFCYLSINDCFYLAKIFNVVLRLKQLYERMKSINYVRFQKDVVDVNADNAILTSLLDYWISILGFQLSCRKSMRIYNSMTFWFQNLSDYKRP